MADTSAKSIADTELDGLFEGLRAHAVDCVMLAVSGGTDSLALLHLFARYRRRHGEPARALVVTVDHGWRPEAADEAAFVAVQAENLGLPHETLSWTGTKPETGRQQAARTARYRLMGDRLAREPGSSRALLTGHTADDQAETLLMRLARGSGLDGLSGMAPLRRLSPDSEILLIRPLLDVSRARLAATLEVTGTTPKHDPSNADPAYERVRMRDALKALAPLGLTASALSRSATRLGRARIALEGAARDMELSLADIRPGLFTRFERQAIASLQDEVRIRLLSRALGRHRGAHPPAELAEIETLSAALTLNPQHVTKGATLGGCSLRYDLKSLIIFRELGRNGLEEITLPPDSTAAWDERYEVAVSERATAPVHIRALPASVWPKVKHCYTKLPAAIARTLPSVWHGDILTGLPSPELLNARPQEPAKPCVAPPIGDRSDLGLLPQFAPELCTLRPLLRAGR